MSARIEFCTFSLFVSGKSALPIGVYKLLMQKVQSSRLLLVYQGYCWYYFATNGGTSNIVA